MVKAIHKTTRMTGIYDGQNYSLLLKGNSRVTQCELPSVGCVFWPMISFLWHTARGSGTRHFGTRPIPGSRYFRPKLNGLHQKGKSLVTRVSNEEYQLLLSLNILPVSQYSFSQSVCEFVRNRYYWIHAPMHIRSIVTRAMNFSVPPSHPTTYIYYN